jgi:hypothetical protein
VRWEVEVGADEEVGLGENSFLKRKRVWRREEKRVPKCTLCFHNMEPNRILFGTLCGKRGVSKGRL